MQSIYDQPAYSCLQAAQYVGVPYATLRIWSGTDGLIVPSGNSGFSFNNLAEAHVLKAMRKIHNLPLQRIRKALKELAKRRHTDHPLLDEYFETDGVDLCIREDGDVVNLSRHSQKEFREFVSLYLQRVDRNANGRVISLHPFIAEDLGYEPKTISISPAVSFGKPVLTGTGISTSVIVGRFHARDSMLDLAAEYQVSISVLEDAIRWETRNKAA